MHNDSAPPVMLGPFYAIQASRWAGGAAHTLFIYDLILTSSSEYQYIWKARWSLGKILYILVRYPYNFGVLGLTLYLNAAPNSALSPEFCKGFMYWEGFAGWFQIVIVQLIMGLRTAALYNLDLKLVLCLALLGCFSVGIILTSILHFLLSAVYSKPLADPELVFCAKMCPTCHQISRFVFLPMMIFDSVVFLLTLYKYTQHSQRKLHIQSLLMRTLYRDAFLYFAAIFTATLVNFLFFVLAPEYMMELSFQIFRSILGIVCGRLLLNLRCAILSQPSDDSSTTYPGMNFAAMSGNLEMTGVSTRVGKWNTAKHLSPLGTLRDIIQDLSTDDRAQDSAKALYGGGSSNPPMARFNLPS